MPFLIVNYPIELKFWNPMERAKILMLFSVPALWILAAKKTCSKHPFKSKWRSKKIVFTPIKLHLIKLILLHSDSPSKTNYRIDFFSFTSYGTPPLTHELGVKSY